MGFSHGNKPTIFLRIPPRAGKPHIIDSPGDEFQLGETRHWIYGFYHGDTTGMWLMELHWEWDTVEMKQHIEAYMCLSKHGLVHISWCMNQ